jgi:uncharacterized protein YkwD
LKIKELLQNLLLLALLFGAAALIVRAQIRSVNADNGPIETPAGTSTPADSADQSVTPDPSSTPSPTATLDLTTTPDSAITPTGEAFATATVISPENNFSYLPLQANLPSLPEDCTPYPYIPVYSMSIQQELAALINNARLSKGVPALNIVPLLSQAAQRHAQDMAENGLHDHIGSDGSDVGSRAIDACYEWLHIGQILGNNEDAGSMFTNWKNTENNSQLIFSAEYIDLGIGYVYDPDSEDTYYWVVVFGRPVSAGEYND